MVKENIEPENSQSHKKTPRIHKKIMCDVCGAKISSAHKSKHKKTKACQQAGKLIDDRILLRIEKNETKRKSYADHVSAKDDLLKMIHLVEEKIIIKKKPLMAAGMTDIKSLFMSSIIVPIKMKDRKNRPISFFLYGPSGNGKSMIVRNLCAASEITLFEVTMKGLMRYHAEELALCDLIFRMAAHYSPAVIFFDKADQIFNVEATTTTAERATTYLKLIEENSSSENPSFIIAATTKPQETCREFLTNFARFIHVGIPSKTDRMEILKSKFPPEKFADDVDFAVLAGKTEGFSAHDLEFLCNDVYHLNLENYTRSNFDAISSIGFSLTNNMMKSIEESRFHKLTMNDFSECLAKRVPNSSDIVNKFLEKWSPNGKEPNKADFHSQDCTCFRCTAKERNESNAFDGAFKGKAVLIGGEIKEKGKTVEKDE